MKTIVIGAGEVGSFLSSHLSETGHDVTLIEADAALAKLLDGEIDARVLAGNGSSASMLQSAGIAQADSFLAMTSDDRTNLVAVKVAKHLCPDLFTVARIHDQTYLDNSVLNYEELFGTDLLLNPEALCAVELAKLIRHPGRVSVENLARGQIEVQNIAVSPRSKLAGLTLKEIRVEGGLRVGTITRDGEVSLVSADTRLEVGDQLTVFGSPEPLASFRQRLDPGEVQGSVRVVLYGATEITFALLRLLSHPRFRIRVIEQDDALCERLLERFPRVTLIKGDATSKRLLEEEQVGSSDHFIACTKRDEDNIMTCLQAAKLGVGKVQIVINKADYETLLDDLRQTMGVARIVSPRQASVNEVMRYLNRERVVEHESMSVRGAKVLEVLVREDSEAAGLRVMDLKLPRDCVIVALLRSFKVKVPGAQDEIFAGDRLVILVKEEDTARVIHHLSR